MPTDPTDPYADPYGGPSGFDNSTEGIPFDLFGSGARNNVRRQMQAGRMAAGEWKGLRGQIPGVDTQQVDTSNLRDMASAEGVSRGSEAAYRGMAQMAGQGAAAQRGGIRQQAEARGMGNSGASMAAELQAGQAGADMSAQGGYQATSDAQKMKLAAAGQLAGVEGQNISRVQGQKQQGFQNREDIVAGLTGQYNRQGQTNADQAEKDRQQQAQAATAAMAIIAAL